MKYLSFIFIFLLCCTAIEQPTPMECYCSTIKADMTTGEIIQSTAEHAFIYNQESLQKWKEDEGISVTYDTIKKVVTITSIKCIDLSKQL